MGKAKTVASSANWTAENIAWLSGLMEGEGCFSYRTDSNTGKRYFTIRLQMTDFDVVRRAFAVAGMGSINGPYFPEAPRKPVLMWSIANEGHAVALVAAMWPWLGERRRERAAELIEVWKSRERGAATKANGRWRG